MKAIYSLAILSYFAFGEAAQYQNGTAKEYCEEQCANVCVPCQTQKTCSATQTYCGLEDPDPAFGGVCPAHHKCVENTQNCPCQDKDGKDYPLTTIVNCTEDQILCKGTSPGNDCPGQDFCHPRGFNAKGDKCEGFCPPPPCSEDQLHCEVPPNPITGCAVPALCIPKAKDKNNNFCNIQQCPVLCEPIQHLCVGKFDEEVGCKEADICVPRGTGNNGDLCPGKCPVTCDSVTQIQCKGQPGPNGCIGPDVCHDKARDVNGKFCADNSDSHDCPIVCPSGTTLCEAKTDILGCKEQAKCVDNEKDDDGDDCYTSSTCPTICQPNEVSCPAGTDENGCKKPAVCHPQERDYDGELCDVHCPGICGVNQILCGGHRDDSGCTTAETCHEVGKKKKGNDIGGQCPGHCPGFCNSHEVLCPSQEDCYGCKTEEVCRPKAKNKAGLYCPDDSASHDCPKECDEAKGEVICPTYEDKSGCKPAATCTSRPHPKDSQVDFCPAHSVCEKQCQWDEMKCIDNDEDSRGCKNPDLCLPRGKDKDGNLCIAHCPAKCTDNQYFCAGTIQANGCRSQSVCVEKKYDNNTLECPQVCPVACSAQEKKIIGETDARGCKGQDTCVAYKCHHWTQAEKDQGCGKGDEDKDKETCEANEGYIFTNGEDSLAPGCGICSCCKPKALFFEFQCDSWDWKDATCATGKNIVDIRLLHQDSWSACTMGVSFGFTGKDIWVKDGCRAKFEIEVEA